MGRIEVGSLLIPLYIFYTLITGPTLSYGNKLVYHICFDINSTTLTISKVLVNLTAPQVNRIDSKILKVGEELWKETLPLQMGSRLYLLQGLEPHTWYEAKISYPASIPASFSLQLRRGNLNSALRVNRRLLNTEKLIFKTENIDISNQGETYVLVTVEPEGVVAVPGVQERQLIIFNIVCDELLLGIPYRAWWIVLLVVLCLGFALIIPSFLPPFLLPKNQSPLSFGHNASKDS